MRDDGERHTMLSRVMPFTVCSKINGNKPRHLEEDGSPCRATQETPETLLVYLTPPTFGVLFSIEQGRQELFPLSGTLRLPPTSCTGDSIVPFKIPSFFQLPVSQRCPRRNRAAWS